MDKTIGPVSEELARADLGDRRLSKRLGRIADAWCRNPGESLPKAMGDGAALEAAYRFMSNDKVTAEGVLAPHIEATLARASEEDVVLAVHDTTQFRFEGRARSGLGRINGRGEGFFGHVTLALSENRRPLGIAGFHHFVRDEPPPGRKKRKTYGYQKRRRDKESARWRLLVDRVEAGTARTTQLVHVMDREADSYELMAHILSVGSHFVIRAKHDRALVGEADDGSRLHLRERIESTPSLVAREVELSSRTTKCDWFSSYNRAHPAREARTAHLSVSATPVKIARSWALKSDQPPAITLNLVRVFEPNPPPDCSAVEWLLLTDLSADTPEQVARIVDYYCARWLIEEFFKATKSGCQYEKLQLESLSALLNALATVLPIAYQMLLLRHISRETPNRSATNVLTPGQLDVLRALSRPPLPAEPTARDALLAVATLGGHIKNNGDPGWLVLYRGFRDLLLLERGWQARCDQS